MDLHVCTCKEKIFFNVIAMNDIKTELGHYMWCCDVCHEDVFKFFHVSFWTEVLHA